MANTVRIAGKYGVYYYIDSSLSSERLTSSQMESNARYIYSWCKNEQPSWTLEAIAAILGNMQSEGIMNPAQWEYGKDKRPTSGYGLVQWTPSTNFTDWANGQGLPLKAIDSQMMRIEYERAAGLQYYKTSKYNFSFTDFLTGKHTVDELARAWLYNYERPGDPASSESIRVTRAVNWYNTLSGAEPTPPDPEVPDPGPDVPQPPGEVVTKKMPFYMYPSWRRQNVNYQPIYTTNSNQTL